MTELEIELGKAQAYSRSLEIEQHSSTLRIRELEAEVKDLKNQIAGLTGPDGHA